MYSIYSIDTLDEEMTHNPGWMDQAAERVHHASQNSKQLKIMNWFMN